MKQMTMNQNLISFSVAIAFLVVFQSCNQAGGQSNDAEIMVKIRTKNPGQHISETAIGLSYEAKELLPNEEGLHYFRPDNETLLTMFETLGVKHLRIGGNSVDASNIPIPKPEDIHAFFKFAKAANVKVIYSVRLQDGDPQSVRQVAKIIYENYSDILESFAIGNEPGYYKDYDLYVSKWTAIRDAILNVYPDAVFSGPDQNPDAERLQKLVDDFGVPKGSLVQVTQHNYPFGCSYRNYRERDIHKLIPFGVEESIEKMLSDSVYAIYEDILKGMIDATKGTPVTFRLSETNSFWYSGLRGVSDCYASALWALDYMRWWTSHGAEGLNFHTGDLTGGEIILPCRYAAFVSKGEGYEAMPLAYGMKLFDLGGYGCSLPVEINSNEEEKLAVYANMEADSMLYITLVNSEYGDVKSKTVGIQFDFPLSGSGVDAVSISAKENNLAAAEKDIRLGGAIIDNKGKWDGGWDVLLGNQLNKGKIEMEIQPASAMVIRIEIAEKAEFYSL